MRFGSVHFTSSRPSASISDHPLPLLNNDSSAALPQIVSRTYLCRAGAAGGAGVEAGADGCGRHGLPGGRLRAGAVPRSSWPVPALTYILHTRRREMKSQTFNPDRGGDLRRGVVVSVYWRHQKLPITAAFHTNYTEPAEIIGIFCIV